MGRAKRTREPKYETPSGAATADGAPTAEGGGATRNVRGPASWSLRQSESLGAFRRAPVEVLNQIYECLDARGLGLLECASVGLEREARAAAAQRARALYPDAASAAALGLIPEELGARYLAGRALPWTAPAPRGAKGPAVAPPPAVARLGPAAFYPAYKKDPDHAPGQIATFMHSKRREMAALLKPGAEDDTIFFVAVLRRRAGDTERTPLVQQAIPASLLSKGNPTAVALSRRPTFEVLRPPMDYDVANKVEDPFEDDWADPSDEEMEAWTAFESMQWDANYEAVEHFVSADQFSITVHAASINDASFVCVLDRELHIECKDTRGYLDDIGVSPVFGEGTVGMASVSYPEKHLLQGTGTHVLQARAGVAISVVRHLPVAGGDFVQTTLRMDKLALHFTPYVDGAQPREEVFGRTVRTTTLGIHRHHQGIAVLRAIDDAWFPSPLRVVQEQ